MWQSFFSSDAEINVVQIIYLQIIYEEVVLTRWVKIDRYSNTHGK